MYILSTQPAENKRILNTNTSFGYNLQINDGTRGEEKQKRRRQSKTTVQFTLNHKNLTNMIIKVFITQQVK